MKNFVFILGAILITGCATNKCGITEKYEEVSYIYAIDSTSKLQESPAHPGTFLKVYDTLSIEVKTRLTANSFKTTYKLLKN